MDKVATAVSDVPGSNDSMDEPRNEDTTIDFQEMPTDVKQKSNHVNEWQPPYALSWTNIGFNVPDKQTKSTKRILHQVNGHIAPGQVSAILGPSGSGKTTLLDILADRISNVSNISGDVYVNGKLREVKTFRAVSSYVAQEDSLMGSFTVIETLRFAAKLSLPSSMSPGAREARVQSAIDDMGLRVCETTLVGDLFRKGISGGQKRRLSIAIELLSRPSILLLDEPTSGLDSASTYAVMKYIVEMADKAKRTVLCTIHQPSSAVYEMFHSVSFLVAGEVAFFGPPSDALEHFAALGHPCPKYTNPAEFILALINTDFEGHADVPGLIEAFKTSATMKSLNRNIEVCQETCAGVDPSQVMELTPHALTQFVVLGHRQTLNNIRNPGIYWVRILMYFILSLMIGTMYLRTNDDITPQDKVPLLFYVQAFLVFMSVAVLPFFIENRAVFQRERANNSLSVGAFVSANFLAALPGIFLIAVLSSVLVVFLAGLNSFGYFLLNLFLSLVVAESLMHVIGSAVPHYIIGIALGAGIFGMFMLCEGFMVPRESIPGYWIWAYYIAFHTYSFESFIFEQFKDEGEAGEEILTRLGMLNADVERNMVILAGYAVFLQAVFFAILYFFHTGRR